MFPCEFAELFKTFLEVELGFKCKLFWSPTSFSGNGNEAFGHESLRS